MVIFIGEFVECRDVFFGYTEVFQSKFSCSRVYFHGIYVESRPFHFVGKVTCSRTDVQKFSFGLSQNVGNEFGFAAQHDTAHIMIYTVHDAFASVGMRNVVG